VRGLNAEEIFQNFGEECYRILGREVEHGDKIFLFKQTCVSVFMMREKHIYSYYSNIYSKRCNVTQFILCGNCSICFGWYFHPSSGAQIIVSTESGICHTVTVTCHYSGR